MKKRRYEHDGCAGCEHEEKYMSDEPCCDCRGTGTGLNDLYDPINVLSEDDNADPTNPQHYKNCSIECVDMMLIMFGRKAVYNFCICNAIKYLWRYKDKNGIEDIDKAIWYANKSYKYVGKGKKKRKQIANILEMCERIKEDEYE